MKNLIPLALVTLVLVSCSKNSSNTPPPPSIDKTALKVTVLDDGGGTLTDATVSIYKSLEDFSNDLNFINRKNTDVSGSVTFGPVESGIYYYVRVVKGCKNNIYGTGIIRSGIVSYDETSSVSVQVRSTGVLKFVNTTNDHYKIYVNGIQVLSNMPGTSTQYLYNVITGDYTIRVVQTSGYLFTPTDKTYMGTLNCGGTLMTTF